MGCFVLVSAKRLFPPIFLFAVMLPAVLLLYLHCSAIPPKNDPHPPLDPLVTLLEDGDLIFRKGYGFWSEQFEDVASRDHRFSHCGVLRRTSDGWVVIHAAANDATGQGTVQPELLSEFLQKSQQIGIFRLKLPEESIRIFVESAESRCGTPFDYRFEAREHTRLYCTELLFFALQKAAPQIHIVTMHYAGIEIIPFDTFYSPEIAEPVYAWSPPVRK